MINNESKNNEIIKIQITNIIIFSCMNGQLHAICKCLQFCYIKYHIHIHLYKDNCRRKWEELILITFNLMLAYAPMKKLMNYFKSESKNFIDFLFVCWCLMVFNVTRNLTEHRLCMTILIYKMSITARQSLKIGHYLKMYNIISQKL